MVSIRRVHLIATVVLGAALPSASVRACSACGCSLDSDMVAIGDMQSSRAIFGLRAEYMDQSQLRSGTSSVDRSTLAFPNDQEVQRNTLTRTLWFDADYALTGNWELSVRLPFTERTHSTVAEGDTELSTSQARGLGDARLDVHYQRGSLWHGLSFNAGLKLPTGRTDQVFDGGPQAGSLLDRGLQLGTGTTDFALGVSGFVRLSRHVSWFAQTEALAPLNANDGFRPARTLAVNSGIRFLTTNDLTPQVQLNARWSGRETGPNADTPNSGGFQLELSPGLSAAVGDNTLLFAFVQVPLAQRVNGLQLTPRWSLSLGLRYSL